MQTQVSSSRPVNAVIAAALTVILCSLTTAVLAAPLTLTSIAVPGVHNVYGVGVAETSHSGRTLIVSARNTRNSSVMQLFLHNRTVRRLMGTPEVTQVGCWESENDEAITVDSNIAPTGVEVLNDYTILFADGMPGSRIFMLSTPATYVPFFPHTIRIQRPIGGLCNFTQPSFQPLTRASHPIGPPEFTLYMHDREELYFSQFRNVALIANDTSYTFFGNPQRAGTRMDLFNNNPIDRLSATTDGVSQMTRIGDSLFVAEGSMQTVREVSLTTGVARPVVGSITDAVIWPPPSCVEGSPCTTAGTVMIYPTALAALIDPATEQRVLFVGDRSTGVIWRANIDANIVYVVAGKMLQPGRRDGPTGTSGLLGVRQMAATADALYISDGTLRKLTFDTPMRLPDAKVNKPVCDIFKLCNGRAVEAYGIPSIKCTCVCRSGWSGSNCTVREPWNLITRTKTFSHTHTTTIPLTPAPTPAPPPPPNQAQEGAQVSVLVTSVAVGVINPTVAAQASRARILLQISTCQKELDEELDFSQSALLLSLGTSRFRRYWGAVAGNVALILLLLGAHAAVAYTYALWNDEPLIKAHSKLRFPSIHAFWIMLLLQGTVMGSTMILGYGDHVGLRVAGFVGIVLSLSLIIALIHFFKNNFRAVFEPAAPPTGTAAASAAAPSRGFRGWLFDPKGEWKDDRTMQKHRFGLWFYDYTPSSCGFICVELSMCFLGGILDGIRPEGAACLPLLISVGLVYTAFFVIIVAVRPYLTNFNFICAAFVACFQAIAALQLVALALSGDDIWKRSSNLFTTITMYFVAIKGFFDIAEAIKLVLRFVLKKLGIGQGNRRTAGTASDSDAQDSRLDIPLTSRLALVNNSFITNIAGGGAGIEIPNDSFLIGAPAQRMAPANIDDDDIDALLAGGPSRAVDVFEGFGPRIDATPSSHARRELMTHELMRMHLEEFAAGGGGAGSSSGTGTGSSGAGSGVVGGGIASQYLHPHSLQRHDSQMSSLHQRTPSTFSSTSTAHRERTSAAAAAVIAAAGNGSGGNGGRFSNNNSFALGIRQNSSSNTLDNHSFSSAHSAAMASAALIAAEAAAMGVGRTTSWEGSSYPISPSGVGNNSFSVANAGANAALAAAAAAAAAGGSGSGSSGSAVTNSSFAAAAAALLGARTSSSDNSSSKSSGGKNVKGKTN